MVLGTAHIHLLDTEQFSDYSPPIELSGLGRAAAFICVDTRDGGELP